MKKLILFIAIMLVGTGVMAQNYGYVEMRTILEQMPEYKSAIDQLDKLAEQYQAEVERRLTDVQTMFDEYQKNRNGISSSYQRVIEEQIIKQEQEVTEYQESIFGQDGEMMRRQQQLLQPIETKVNNALAAVAQENGIDMIFDASSETIIVYKSANANVTQKVIDKLR